MATRSNHSNSSNHQNKSATNNKTKAKFISTRNAIASEKSLNLDSNNRHPEQTITTPASSNQDNISISKIKKRSSNSANSTRDKCPIIPKEIEEANKTNNSGSNRPNDLQRISSNSSLSPQSSSDKKFSLRNSLRSAQPLTTLPIAASLSNCDKLNLFSKPLMPPTDIDNFREFLLYKGVDANESYELLNRECFCRIKDGSLICMLCGSRNQYHSELTFEKHIQSDKHNIQYCELRFELLRQLPEKSSLQMNSVSELLNKWFITQSLTNDEILYRESIISEMDYIIKAVDPQCQCRLTGSLLTGTSSKHSDINLELLHPNSYIFESDPRAKQSIHHKLIDPDAGYGCQINFHTIHYDLIANPIDTLYKIMNLLNTDYQQLPFVLLSDISDLSERAPKLTLKHKASNIKVELICYAQNNHKLSVLLQTYMSLDDRACILGTLVKHWANLCSIDIPEQGTFPPYTYLILVIYYLQRTSPPILPCLHVLASTSASPPIQSKSTKATPSTSDVSRNFTKLTIDDSSAMAEQEADQSSDSESCDERNDEDSEVDDFYFDYDNEVVKNLDWTSENTSSVHELFIGFMRFMESEIKDVRYAISIRTFEKINPGARNWGTGTKAIENPVRPKNNLSRVLATKRSFEFIRDCFRESYFYLTSIPSDSFGKLKRERQCDPLDYSELYVHKARLDNYFFMRNESIKRANKYDPIGEMIGQNLFAKDVQILNHLFDLPDVQLLPSRMVHYYNETFLRPSNLTAARYCHVCRKFGHYKQLCPYKRVDNLQKDFKNYDPDLDSVANFDQDFYLLYKNNQISEILSAKYHYVVGELNQLINDKTGLDCCLQLFGSTVNDLGNIESDLDICLTLNGNQTGKGVNCVKVLKTVMDALEKDPLITNIESILAARVPILKFKYRGFEMDLSMYNLCALYNSRLLKTYAKVDPRVPQLFFLVKRHAKDCGIADASKGGLSSYAWSLLVVHYLQQVDPPLLPVLQETENNSPKPIFGVNGWNVWFDEDISSRSLPQNNQSVTQLFKGFFLYYGTFDFSLHVISIRKSTILTKFRKNWYDCMIAIEDPFELTYNLAGRLDDAMAAYVINSFSLAFRNFVRIQHFYSKLPPALVSKLDIAPKIFNARYFINSPPPYRGCRYCNKIGHRLKDCPKKTTGRQWRLAKNN